MPVGLVRKDTSKSNGFSSFPIAFELEEWETKHKTGWVKEKVTEKQKYLSLHSPHGLKWSWI